MASGPVGKAVAAVLSSLVFALLAGCGGSTGPSGNGGSGREPTGFATGGVTSPGAEPVPTGEKTTYSSVPGKRRPSLELSISQCVRPGDEQKLTIKSEPTLRYSFGTTWPDGQSHHDWKARGLGQIPPDSEVTAAWEIPADAGLGSSRTDVGVGGEIGGEEAAALGTVYWTIARSC